MKPEKDLQNVPKLRFPEFEGEWTFHNLGEFVAIKTGNRDTKDRKTDGEYPFFVRSDNVERIDTFSYNGEAILTSGDGVGVGKNFHYINAKFDYHQRVYCLHDFHKEAAGKYVYFYFAKTFSRRVIKLSAKNSVDSVRMDMISMMPFPFPTLPEQQKIAAFLSAVDKKIQQLTRKKELLELYKKGVMQKIFSQEIRFKREDGSDYPDWEEKRLGELFRLQGGYAFKSEDFEDAGIPVIRISNISNSSNHTDPNSLVYHKKFEKDSQFLIRKGDLLVAMSGATTGKACIYNLEKYSYLNQRVGLFRQKLEDSFYAFLIQFVFSPWFKRQLVSVLVAGAQPNVSSKDIERFKIFHPCVAEQKRIATLLSKIDTAMDAIQKQIAQTQQFKKGLLQQMFV